MIDAGILLRQLREEAGMSIEAMSAALKVSVPKLNALEEGRMDAFPNTAFVRALAMSVCKVLKVDHTEVLAKLPLPDSSNLRVGSQIQQPFKENGSRLSLHNTTVDFFARWMRGKYLLPAFIVLAAFFVYWWPSLTTSQFVAQLQPQQSQKTNDVAVPLSQPELLDQAALVVTQEAAASAASSTELPTAEGDAGNTVVPASLSSASAPIVSADSSEAAPNPEGAVTLLAKDESWVRIKDADGTLLIRRLVFPGEQLTLTGKLPLRVTVGNVAAVELQYEGKNLDLTDHARGNVARIDLE